MAIPVAGNRTTRARTRRTPGCHLDFTAGASAADPPRGMLPSAALIGSSASGGGFTIMLGSTLPRSSGLPGGVLDRIEEVIRPKRPGKQVTLGLVATEFAQPGKLEFRLDTFGDGPQAEIRRQVDDSGDDLVIFAIGFDVRHEGLVDLDERQWQLAEVGERRVAGTEIVETYVHTQIPDAAELVHYVRLEIHDGGFGELEVELPSVQARLVEAPPYEIRQVAGLELSSRKVDRDAQGARDEGVAVPGPRLH